MIDDEPREQRWLLLLRSRWRADFRDPGQISYDSYDYMFTICDIRKGRTKPGAVSVLVVAMVLSDEVRSPDEVAGLDCQTLAVSDTCT